MKRLVIISHTEHYLTSDGIVLGLGSTVTEINHLLHIFDEIYHLAMLHTGAVPASVLPYESDKIHFIPIPTVGGTGLKNKLSILWKAPKTLRLVSAYLKKADVFQFRAPTGIGVFVIPYLIFFSRKKGWFKYAGSWEQQNTPVAFRFQKKMLKMQSRKVTINGHWENQPSHCLSFENPCITSEELKIGQEVLNKKNIDQQSLELCFVGRLEEAKGLGLLIKALNLLSREDKLKIDKIHIVGSGSLMPKYRHEAQKSGIPYEFYGSLDRNGVHEIYQKSHFLLLPSQSEGFPKVVSEAMNYGCIPIVTNMKTIAHYVKNRLNGFLLNELNPVTLSGLIKKSISLDKNELEKIKLNTRTNIELFSYKYYCNRINDGIL